MNILNKIVTALRGGATEAGEAFVDTQALRILDQEIRDSAEALNQSKDSLASIIARQKLSEGKAGTILESIKENEGYAFKALDKADETLAMDVAEKIAALETSFANEKEVGEGFARSAKQLREAIAQAEKDVQYMKNQVDTVKATESVQKAEAAVSERHSGTRSKLHTAMESLERIKEKQALTSAQMNAARDLANEGGSSSLDKRLEDAGIKDTNKAADVLERLKQQRA